MPFLHILVLTIVQGITEFLPVSSSGHLVLVPLVTGWQDQGLVMDVAVHVGTLAAVLVYFWRDLGQIVLGWIGGNWRRHDRRLGRALGFYLVVSAIPVIVAGGVIYLLGHETLRNPEVVAWATIGFGILLYLADRIGLTVREVEHTTLGHAFFIGLAQVLALIPGASRSGVTMTAARWLGYERPAAAPLRDAHVDPGDRGERRGSRIRGLAAGAIRSSAATRCLLRRSPSRWRSWRSRCCSPCCGA